MDTPPPPSSSSLIPTSLDVLDPSAPQLLQELATVSIPSLPTFSLELHLQILRFCDAPTLAQTSRVSLAFLELSGPLLYQDVTLVGFLTLHKLFYPKHTHQPQIDSYTSLAQTKTLTIVIRVASGLTGPVYQDRLPSSQPLTLDTLRVQTSISTRFPFHLFDPVTATFAHHHPLNTRPRITVLLMPARPAVWSRLSKLILRDCQLFPRTIGGSSKALVELVGREEQARGLEIVFEILRGPSSFLNFVFAGLEELMAGRRAVKVVVVRAPLGKDLQDRAVAKLGREKMDEMKRKEKLRFEVLEE